MQNKREIKGLLYCFLALSVLSAVRQIWLHAGGMQLSPIEAVAVFFGYTALLNVWWGSIRTRIAQPPVRRFLTVGHWLIVGWFVVRLLQNGVVAGAEQYGRFSGYLLAIPVIYGFLMNFYASLLLGKADDARLDRRWYLLLIPTTLIVIGYLTNNLHSFMNTEVPVDAGASNHYRVNVGSVLAAVWIVAMELLKLVNILRSGRRAANRALKLLPLLELVLLLLYTIPYAAIDFAPPRLEFIEYTASLFFYEILVWETCVLIGVLPVNTDYREIFHRSDIGMQLLHPNAEVFLRSATAYPVDADLFCRLQKEGALVEDGMTLQMTPLKDGCAVFHSDTREVQQLAEELQEKKAALESKAVCLREELSTRQALRRIREQQRLYRLVDEQTQTERQELVRVIQAMRAQLVQEPEAPHESDAFRDLLERFCRLALEVKNKGNQILEREYRNETDHHA